MKLTDARYRALEAMAAVHPAGARESNVTDKAHGYVYWQAARWLIENELATYQPGGWTYLAFTEKGLALAQQKGLL